MYSEDRKMRALKISVTNTSAELADAHAILYVISIKKDGRIIISRNIHIIAAL